MTAPTSPVAGAAGDAVAAGTAVEEAGELDAGGGGAGDEGTGVRDGGAVGEGLRVGRAEGVCPGVVRGVGRADDRGEGVGAAVFVAPRTTTVPVMNGWTSQW